MTQFAGDAQFGSPNRQRILTYIVLGMAVLYIGRLGYLQIIQGNVYRLKAETQAIKQLKVEPFRGNMIDRNGRYIVQNAPGFTVTITPYEFTESSCTRLSHIIGVSDSLIWQEVRKAAANNKFAPLKLVYARDVGFDVISAIEEQTDALPGVSIIIDPKRLYAFEGNGAHLFGYAREVSESQLKALGDAYEPGDMTGQSGLEKSYEPFVRGTKGYQFVAVNKNGKRVSSFNDGMSDLQSLEGDDLYLGLDAELQELTEKLMTGRRGGAVAIDPSTGEILCYVSKPDYDLRKFAGKTRRTYYGELYDDPQIPLLNRVSMSNYSPGSTFKPFMALACLQEGLITDRTRLLCNGGYSYGGRFAKCHGGVHGMINMTEAMQLSCNAFFYQLGLKLGVEKFAYYGTQFGFGQRTRADVTEESKGILPNRDYMNRHLGVRGWTNYVLMNWGIGQGEVNVTPLQMVAYIGAIANEGTWYQPHAVRATYNKVLKKKQFLSYDSHKLPVEQKYFQAVKEAMRQVVIAGTGRVVNMPEIEVCGKTGTAQTGGKDQSWFVCFAPKVNPTIAIVVTVEEGGFGAATAGPIVRKMLDYFFLKKWPIDVKRDTLYSKVSMTPNGAALADSTKPVLDQPVQRGPFMKDPAHAAPRKVVAPVPQ